MSVLCCNSAGQALFRTGRPDRGMLAGATGFGSERPRDMGSFMSFRDGAALIRRYWLVATAVLLLGAGAGYSIRTAPPLYSESAALVLGAPGYLARADLRAALRPPIIATELLMGQAMTNPPGIDQVRAAGGTAQFEFVPYNLYNMEYPDYAEPLTTLSATSASRASVRRTFRVILRLYARHLAAIQAQAGVPPRDQILVSVSSDTGPIIQPGSPVRVLAGLALLTAVAIFMAASLLCRLRPGAYLRVLLLAMARFPEARA
jgi:hypothetical protein